MSLSEKSEPLDLQTILKHAKIVWVIRTSPLKNQNHGTHNLYSILEHAKIVWVIIPFERLEPLNSHAMLEHAKYLSDQNIPSDIRATGLTHYVGTCTNCLSDQNISFERSEPLDSLAMLEHAKIVWVIRTSLMRDQSHWTYILYQNMQRLFEWSEHFLWNQSHWTYLLFSWIYTDQKCSWLS